MCLGAYKKRGKVVAREKGRGKLKLATSLPRPADANGGVTRTGEVRRK